MKTRTLLFAFVLCSITLNAQLNVWTGTVDDKWSNEDNWSGTVPISTDDVLIPSGFVVTVDSPANILSIEVQGNSVLNVDSSIIIQNPSEFEDNVVVNWVSGDLIGPGILLNSGTINMSFISFDLSGSAVLNNPGTINMTGGNILISSDSVLNNSGTGIIDFKVDGGQFGATSGDLINYGTIKTSFPNPTDEGFIASDIINQDGIFQIDSGSLNLNNTVVNFMGGEFNVLANASLNLNSPMTVMGTLFGNILGSLNWADDIDVTSTAVFNFSGNSTINWNNGDLQGGGTLANLSTINRPNSTNVFIRDASTLENDGEIRLNGTGDIFITSNGEINNTVNGLIDFQVDGAGISFSGGAPNVLNNSGLIQGNLASGSGLINVQVNNSGTIEAVTNTLNFLGTLNNEASGVLKGNGIIDLPVPANFTNNGTLAPGASPGTLSLIGNYSSSATTFLDLELNGSNQGVDYDLLAIQGNGLFDGDVQVALGFSPNVNDEFIVATTSGSISACTLPATKTADFGGSTYEFSVACRNNDEVVLTVTNETLSLSDFEDESSSIIVYPNPATDMVRFSTKNINKIEIYDVAGKKVLESKSGSVSVKTLENGVYIIKVISADNTMTTKRLIKQ